MSKQARCVVCKSTSLQSLSRVREDGVREWGAACPSRHWGRTENPPRDFSHDSYGTAAYAERCIPPKPMMNIRGAVQRKDFDWLVANL
eukprot:2877749-Rhodomonas_salina.1